MSRPRRSCQGVLFVGWFLALLTLAPASHARANRALEPPTAQVKAEGVTRGALQKAWELLSRLWAKEGSAIDPFGKPSSPPNGSSMSTTSPFGVSPYGSDAPRE